MLIFWPILISRSVARDSQNPRSLLSLSTIISGKEKKRKKKFWEEHNMYKWETTNTKLIKLHLNQVCDMSNEVSNHHQRREQQPQPMKVRIIETQFVETDERQFKMVVQKFTGMNSVMTSSRREAEDDDKVGAGRKRELQLATEPAASAMAALGELDV